MASLSAHTVRGFFPTLSQPLGDPYWSPPRSRNPSPLLVISNASHVLLPLCLAFQQIVGDCNGPAVPSIMTPTFLVLLPM